MALKPSSKFGKMKASSNYMADWNAKRTALDSEGDKLSATKGDMTDWRKRSMALDSEGDKLAANKKPRAGARAARITALKGKLK